MASFSYINKGLYQHPGKGNVFPYSESNLRDLVNAAVHPSWQFREYARGILNEQLNNVAQRRKLELILNDLKGEEYRYLLKELER